MWQIKYIEMLINSVKDHVEKVKINISVYDSAPFYRSK